MELNKETFTMEDLKKLLRESFEFDYDKHRGKVKFFPLTIVEWHKSDVFKNELSLDNIQGNILEWRRPFDATGTYFREQKSFAVFFQRSEIRALLEYYKDTLDGTIICYVVGVFHELEHRYQDEFRDGISEWNEIDLSVFVHDIDYFVFKYQPQHYEEHHDEYWIEIDANLYGVERAYDFLKSKGMLTEERKKTLQELKNQYLFDSNNYDIHYFLHECHKIVKKNNWILPSFYPFLSLFYNDNRRFRSINKILNLADEQSLDNEILMMFFSSKDFLDSLHFRFLSLEHKQIIMNAIEYALEVEINRRKKNKEFLQNRQITASQYLDVDKSICSKIAYLNKKLEEFKRLMKIPIMNCNLDEELKK